MRRNKNKRRLLVSVIAVILIFMMVSSMMMAMVYADTKEPSGETKCGVYIENIDVTDMTQDQIQAAIDAKMASLGEETIVLYAGDHEARIKAGSLGLSYKNTNLAAEAYSVRRKGNVLKRFRAEHQLKTCGPIVFTLMLEVSEADVKQVISDSLHILNCDAKSNDLKLNEDNTFTLLPGQEGISVDVAKSAKAVIDYMESEWHGGEGGVNMAANITPYKDSVEDLNKIKDLLGSGATMYYTGDVNHDTNVELAAKNIDGTVVYPGEEFSAEQVIGPTTEEYGFLPGATYESGKVTETYGGGVCQVSTTLYNAVLEAELEIIERHNHSSLVSYVDPGFDAAISENLLDFKFKNNTDAPIYIQAVMYQGQLTFNIYGHETRAANREVRYYSETHDPVEVTTQYVMDAEKPFGTLNYNGGVAGITAETYKQVLVNGEVESDELFNSSLYDMMPLTYTIGTMNADSATISAISAAIATEDLGAIQTAIANGSVIESEVTEE